MKTDFQDEKLNIIGKLDTLRKLSVIIGFILLLTTSFLEYFFSDTRTTVQFIFILFVSIPVFSAGLYNIYHPFKGRIPYPFLAVIAPLAAILGLIGGSLQYTYPLGIAFVILWLYVGIGSSYWLSLLLNILIIVSYIVADVFYIKYSIEYRAFILIFIFGISLIGFLASYILQSVQEELNKQHKIAVSSAKDLEKELQRKSDIYTTLAHEVKTPLTIIRHYFSKYRQNNVDSVELRILQDNLDKLERQMVSLLKFERELLNSENENTSISTGECNIGNLVEKNLPLLRSYFARKEISLDVELEDGMLIKLSQIDAEHVLLNLLENALRYTESKGRVRLEIRSTDEYQVLLSISDNGIGIDKTLRESIFEPYVQIDGIKSSKQGLGLGLVIVKKIVERCGGSISVESEPGEGTEFRVLLPKSEKIDYEPASAFIIPFNAAGYDKDAVETIKSKNGNSGNKIFIVEDNDDLRNFLTEYLSSAFQITAFSNGQQALSGMSNGDLPELIVSDVYMDEMDGLTLLDNIESRFHDAHIPFIFISADDTEQMRLTGLGKGAVDYIVKPFNPQELKTKISTWICLLSGMKEYEKEVINILESEYGLSPRENQVAAMLIQGLSRKMISERLFISMNTVKTHIASIYLKCMVSNKEEFILKFEQPSPA